MNAPKSLTELAVLKRRQAQEERRRGGRYGTELAEYFAGPLEREADALLTLPGAPDVGPGGEVVRTHGQDVTPSTSNEAIRWVARNTLAEGATRVAEDASVRRQDLLLQPSFNALALAIDAAESIDAGNSLEKMLAHQMAVAHEASLRLMNRALSYEAGGRGMREGDAVEACRLANTAARLMSSFQDGMLTLHRLRTGGNQTVTVQHVSVQAGAQAVIGHVQAGGATAAKRRGSKAKDG